MLSRDEAVRANAEKDRFLAVLSHELRTPLTPVLALVDDLRHRSELPPDILSDLHLIRRNVLLEARLVDDLLDVTRIAKGKLQLNPERVDLHRTVEHAVEICRVEAEAKPVAIRLALGALRFHTRGDLGRLQQVFWNLLQNAVKFTPPGGCVTVDSRNPAPDAIEIFVRGTGVGIPAEALPRIFDPFEQGTIAVTRTFGGLGLGLAICKALVAVHGGAIEAASEGCGHGAIFTVRLPAASDEPAGGNGEPPAAPSRRAELRILLVEDHPDTRATLHQLLERRGHRVAVAAGVAEALAAAAAGEFDVLVSDIGLPDGTGLDLMHSLRQRGAALPGIALSGFGMEADIAASRSVGFAHHLVKPVNFQLLEEAIQATAGAGR